MSARGRSNALIRSAKGSPVSRAIDDNARATPGFELHVAQTR